MPEFAVNPNDLRFFFVVVTAYLCDKKYLAQSLFMKFPDYPHDKQWPNKAVVNHSGPLKKGLLNLYFSRGLR